MYHTAYDCTGLKQLPNTLAPVLTYCSNSRCGKLRIQSGFNTQPSIGCLDLDTEEYFKDMESGKAPKCEGCWFTSVKDGYKYADNFFYHDSLDGFYTVYKNDKNQWVNSTFFKLPGLAYSSTPDQLHFCPLSEKPVRHWRRGRRLWWRGEE
ncbi:hypothetical protein Fcan01_21871 [Folsomia candida]|uniref:Uncharacterized protein n=1 Tax=Folsomia candida TaxID=158441 RepID=A0A226DEL1_FOLCA|nr:hypothetical protein Fcan01_21871 [Folsomia candida]